MYIYTILRKIDIFYSVSITLFSWFPWLIIYYFLITTINVKKENDFYKFQISTKSLSFGILIAISISILIVSLGNHPGTKKSGKIYIDEYHSSGWESVTEPLNTKSYLGQKSTYTYYSFVQFLSNLNDTIIIDSPEDYNEITPDDTLIIKTPTVDFSPAIIKSIQSFVKDGGGLFLIGDHTNLYDMNRRLNEIAAPMGVSFRYDATYDLHSTNLTNFDSRYKEIYLSQIGSALDEYKFATSCSIKSNVLSQKVIVGNSLASEQLDLSHINFFGDLSLSESEMFGLFEQCTATNYGKGRIVAFADSTTFSSYSVFMHNNPELIVSIINYLGEKNTFNYALVLSTLLLLLIIGLFFYTNRKNFKTKKIILNIFIIALPTSLFLSNFLLSEIYNKSVQQTNSILDSLETVYFLRDPSEKELSHFVSMGDIKGQFSSLFLGFQRRGCFLRETKNLHDTISGNTKLIVITDPSNIEHNEYHLLDEYIISGGKILFLYKENFFDQFNQIFQFFGIKYAPIPFTTEIVDLEETSEKDYLSHFIYFPSGSVIPEMHSLSNVYNIRLDTYDFDTGQIFVLFSQEYFDNTFLGDPGNAATQAQLNQNNILQAAIDIILKPKA